MKFQVNDRVKANKSGPNGIWRISIHDEGTVLSARTVGRYEYYRVKFESVTGDTWGHHSNDGTYEITAGNLTLVTPGEPPAPPKVFTEAEAIELAQTIVRVARKYAKKHRLCDVVDQALKEAGLEAYMNTTKTVTLTVEVPVSVAPGTQASDDDFVALAKEKVRQDATLDLTGRVR